MKTMKLALLALSAGAATPAVAALTPAIQLTGNVGLSVDGVGSTAANAGTIQAFIPVGATIERAFFYSAGIPSPAGGFSTLAAYNGAGISLGGVAVTNFDTLVGASSPRPEIGRFFTARADVTALVTGLTTGAATPNFSFALVEGAQSSVIDGGVLAIAYRLSSLPTGSVVFLDGGQNTGGETTVVNFTGPIGNPADPNFVAELGLGISYSCCGQTSTVRVNGSTLTTFAGNFDDGAAPSDGSLITVGGLGDTAVASASNYADDPELYDLTPYLATGDTSFSIFTVNPTNDDNIFFASLYTTAIISDVGVPEPATWVMMILGFGAIGAGRRRYRTRVGFV